MIEWSEVLNLVHGFSDILSFKILCIICGSNDQFNVMAEYLW